MKLTLTEEALRYIQTAMTLTTQLQGLGVTVTPAPDSTWNLWNAQVATITDPIDNRSSLAIGPATTAKEEKLVLGRLQPPSGNLPLQPAIEDFPGLMELRRRHQPEEKEEEAIIPPDQLAKTWKRQMDQENRVSRTEGLRKMEEKLRSQELTGSAATSASSKILPTAVPVNFHDTLKQEWTVLEERARRCRLER